MGLDLAHYGLADGEAARERRAGEGAGDLVTNVVVLRTADDLTKISLPAIHLGDLQAICIRVLDGFFDLSDDDSIRGYPFGDDSLHFNAREREEVGDFLNGFPGEIEMSGEPV